MTQPELPFPDELLERLIGHSDLKDDWPNSLIIDGLYLQKRKRLPLSGHLLPTPRQGQQYDSWVHQLSASTAPTGCDMIWYLLELHTAHRLMSRQIFIVVSICIRHKCSEDCLLSLESRAICMQFHKITLPDEELRSMKCEHYLASLSVPVCNIALLDGHIWAVCDPHALCAHPHQPLLHKLIPSILEMVEIVCSNEDTCWKLTLTNCSSKDLARLYYQFGPCPNGGFNFQTLLWL